MTDSSLPTRRITLVVVDGAGGRVLGSLEPFEVDIPWWQELSPIHERVPGVVVLRLLSAVAAPGHVAGGETVYLVEATGAPPAGLRPWAGELDEHPLRMPWARPGGPAEDLAWTEHCVTPTGPPIQHRAWNLSSIWSLPVGHVRVWLKCVPPFFEHEAYVIDALRGGPVPRLLAAEGHRMLLQELPGRDGYEATPEEHLAGLRLLVDMQAASAGRIDDYLSAGVPDCRWEALRPAAERVVSLYRPDDEALAGLLAGWSDRVEEIDSFELPYVLVHGDAHPGNLRIATDPPIWFDWGDSLIGHPLLDLAVLGKTRTSPGLLRAWLDLWCRHFPGPELGRAWRLVHPLAELRLAVLYQRFLDAIEPSERVFHVGDPEAALARAGRALWG